MSRLTDAVRRESARASVDHDALEAVIARVAKRSRRRRFGGLAAGLACGLIIGVLVSNLGELGGRSAASPSHWRGVWPDVTREAAEASQATTDNESSPPWRSDPLLLVKEFGSMVLGWPTTEFLHEGLEDVGGFSEVSVLRQMAHDGERGPVTVGISACSRWERAETACPGALVTLEVLLTRPDVWNITEVENVVLPAIASLTPEKARAFVAGFCEARLAGEGAEAYLSASGADAYSHGGEVVLGEPLLYGNYQGCQVRRMEQQDPASVTVIVELERQGQRRSIETLFVVLDSRGTTRIDWAYQGGGGP